MYTRPALPPAIPRLTTRPAPPSLLADGTTVRITHPSIDDVRFFAVYRDESGSFVLDRVVGASETELTLSPGTWAISAIARGTTESRGARITID